MTALTQDDLNKLLWSAADSARSVVDASVFKDYILAFLFFKYISDIKKAETEGDFGLRLALSEEAKALPSSAVWDYLCLSHGVPVGEDWLNEVKTYEKNVLSKRI